MSASGVSGRISQASDQHVQAQAARKRESPAEVLAYNRATGSVVLAVAAVLGGLAIWQRQRNRKGAPDSGSTGGRSKFAFPGSKANSSAGSSLPRNKQARNRKTKDAAHKEEMQQRKDKRAQSGQKQEENERRKEPVTFTHTYHHYHGT